VAPEWLWLAILFGFGSCIGSFLNVVVYRLPREKSLVHPPSSCPSCGSAIRFYDNIPLLSWLVLRGRCRKCKAAISPRYFVIELVTGLLFAGVYAAYFVWPVRQLGLEGAASIERFVSGGWLLYISSMILLAGLLAASAIDLELWVIPLSLCWFVTAAGVVVDSLAGLLLSSEVIHGHRWFPAASASTGAVAAGAGVGLLVSLALLAAGVFKRSYDLPCETAAEPVDAAAKYACQDQLPCDHRREILKEMMFLAPVVAGALISLLLYRRVEAVETFWVNACKWPVASGALGGLWGYLVGCGVVWLTRILGTLVFGKEAMGLGDVHLMGAAGAVVGPFLVVLAFFAAPFFGLLWAGWQALSRRTRQIPYGPFLSLGVLTVMMLHDRLWVYFSGLYIGR